MRALLPFILLLVPVAAHAQKDLYRVASGTAVFTSSAPLETITARNTAVNGLLDPDERTFVVRIPVKEFQGFNSPLQREHFNENYMVSQKWAAATFQGRIIEAVDLRKNGKYSVRAKGMLTIRGVERERIIPCSVEVQDAVVNITTRFEVVLDEHGIRTPKLVQQKIAATVQVELGLKLEPKDRH